MTNYPPELIEDFEKLAKAQRWDTARDYDGCLIDPQMPKALAAFAHNWHRVRELEGALSQIARFYDDESSTGMQASLLYDASCLAKKLLEKGNE